jgi:uncharacterized protein (TIRG00374 family)
MYYLYRDNSSEELWGYIKNVDMSWAIASWVIGYAAIISRGLRWKSLLQPLGHKPKTLNSIGAVSFSYLANSVVPRSGEVARCAALNQTDDIPVDHLLGTVITERVVDFIMLFLFMAVALFGNTGEFMKVVDGTELPESAKTALTIGGICVVIGLGLLLVLRKQFLKIKFVEAKIVPFLLGLKDGLKAVFSMKQKVRFIAHTLFIWFSYYAMAYVVFLGSPGLEDTPMLTVLVIMIAGGWGMIFPAPNGMGTYQWATILAFGFLALGKEAGHSYAFAVWAIQGSMIISTGLLGMGWVSIAKFRKNRLSEQA